MPLGLRKTSSPFVGALFFLALTLLSASIAQRTEDLPPYLRSASEALIEACAVVQSRYSTPIESLAGYSDGDCDYVPGCDAKSYFPTGWSCNTTYGSGATCGCSGLEISRDTAIHMLPKNANSNFQDSIRESLCRTSGIGDDFKRIAGKYGLVSLFTGFQSGVHVSWPARDWGADPDPLRDGCRTNTGSCQSFEPRFRNWYVVASAGPKNVILILDISGSMNANNRLAIMKDAAKTVLDTLTFADYVTVITFSTGAQRLPGFTETLYQATQMNVEYMKTQIDGLVAEGSTNFGDGFNLAFKSLETSKGNGCHNIILFMSDGAITDGPSIGEVLDTLRVKNTPEIGARIFTYAFGSEADASAPKSIACAHRGIFTSIPDRGDLRSKMAQYYQYIAVSSVRRNIMWSEPYIDCCGMGNVTSVSVACYTGENPPKLLGVVGSTVPFSYLGNVSLEQLLESSKECSPLKLTEEQIEIIRDSERCQVNVLAVGLGVGIGLGLPIWITLVTAFSCCVQSSKKKAEQDKPQNCLDNASPWLLAPLVLPVLLPFLLALPWRFVFLIMAVFKKQNRKMIDFLGLAWLQTTLALLDLVFSPIFVLGIALVAPVYRWIKEGLEATADMTCTTKLHGILWSGILLGIRDLICWAVLFPLTLIAPWRFVIIIKEATLPSSPATKRNIVLRHLVLAILDLCSLPALLLCALVPWRWLPMADEINRDDQTVRERYRDLFPEGSDAPWSRVLINRVLIHGVVWKTAMLVFVDYVCILTGLLTLLMPHRALMLLMTIKDSSLTSSQRAKASIFAFCLTLFDILTIFPLAVILTTIYRAPGLVERTLNEPAIFISSSITGSSVWVRTLWSYRFHREAWAQLGRFIVDVTVFLPMFILCFCAPYRLVPLIIDLCRSGWTQRDRRWLILKNFGLMCADFGALPLAVVLFATVYRIPSLVRRVKKNMLEWGSMEKATSAIMAIESDCTRTHSCVAVRLSASIHRAVGMEFSHLLGDIVPILLAPLTLIAPWRVASTIYAFAKSNTTKERRFSVVINVLLALVDLIHIPFVVIILVFLYRIPTLAEHWAAYSKKAQRMSGWGSAMRSPAPSEAFYILFHTPGLYRGVWKTLGSLLADLPCIIFFLCSIIAPWRFVLIIYDFFKVSIIGNPDQPAANRRRAATLHFFCGIFDLLHLPVILISLVPVYRIPQMIRRFKKMESDNQKGGCCGFTLPDGKTLVRGQMEMPPMLRAFHTWYIYGIFWRHALILFADIGAIIMLSASLMAPWRAIISFHGIMKSIQKDEPISNVYWIAAMQLALALLDVIILPIFFLMLIEPYRMVSFFMELNKIMKSNESITQDTNIHSLVFIHCVLAFLDLLSLIPAAVVLVTVYRVPRSLTLLKQIKNPFEAHGIVWSQFFAIIYELLAIISLVVNVCTLLPGIALLGRYRLTDRKLTWHHLRFDSTMLFILLPFVLLSVLLLPIHLLMQYVARPDLLFLNNHLVHGIRKLADMEMHSLFKYYFLWVIVLVEVFLVAVTIASHFFAFLNFLALCLLCLVSPVWASDGVKRKIIVALWIITLPLFGLLQFVVLHLPRIIASPTMFSSTIFQLCTSQARSLEGCIDFYSPSVVPDIAWGWIWAFWVISYLYSWLILCPWIATYIWQNQKK